MLVDSFEEYEKRWILVKGHVGDDLTILVENRGRSVSTMNDFKVSYTPLR